MTFVLEKISTLTAKGQTTVPEAVRRTLGLGPGDQIAFRVENGSVVLSRVESETEGDPALGAFLDFLAQDIQRRPEGLHALPTELIARIDDLVSDLNIDPDAPIHGDTSL